MQNVTNSTIKAYTFSELVDREARKIVEDMIQAELGDLPLPRDSALDIHVKKVLEAKPEITIQAEKNVEARQDAFSQALRTIGIETEIIKPLDIDLLGDEPQVEKSNAS